MSTKYIAKRTIWARIGGAAPFKVQMKIGKPFKVASSEWACPVVLTGIHNLSIDARGHDAWQALQLAQWLIYDLVAHFVDQGGTLHWSDEDKDDLPLGSIWQWAK
jgi:hypothetical protein